MIAATLDVNIWLERVVPSVDSVRPSECEKCHKGCGCTLARRIIGHGKVLRQLRRLGLGEHVEDIELWLRRFRCLHCGHVMLVGPREVRSRFRYGACVIVLALARWADGETESALRAEFSDCNAPSCTSGRWPVLRRWVEKASWLFGVAWLADGTAREQAAQLTRWVGEQCGHPDSDLPLLERVVQAVRTIVF